MSSTITPTPPSSSPKTHFLDLAEIHSDVEFKVSLRIYLPIAHFTKNLKCNFTYFMVPSAFHPEIDLYDGHFFLTMGW